MKGPANYRTISRDGVQLHLFEAALVRKVPPLVGPRVSLPVVDWSVVVPATGVVLAGGLAITQHGAERKAWKAFDRWQAGRLRWMDPDFTDDALCRPFDPSHLSKDSNP